MRSILAVMVMVGVLLCTGCTAPGMNKKMGFSDAAAVTATAVALDQSKNFDTAKEKTIEVATALKEFIKTGSFGALPLSEVRDQLNKFLASKGWSQYSYIVDAAMAYVGTLRVDTSAIGEDNITLITVGLDGVIRQANRSKAEWATPISGN